MKSTQLYDFTLAANGSQVILADANFYKVLTSTGDLQITRDGGSTVKPMRAGRGEREVPFQRLTIRDISGATNSGTIVVGDSNFIDDTIILSSAINVRPEAHSGSFNDATLFTANTAIQVFAPASNVAGAIILSASIFEFNSAASQINVNLLAKASAPTTLTDGANYLTCAATVLTTSAGTNTGAIGFANLPKEQYVPAGLGLYFICNFNSVAGSGSSRSCRYKLL